jgi:hypothetical protein
LGAEDRVKVGFERPGPGVAGDDGALNQSLDLVVIKGGRDPALRVTMTR